MSLLKEDLGRTRRYQSTCVVLENFAESKIMVLDSCYCQFVMHVRLDGLVQKKIGFTKRTA